jgi:hypothetical protein
VGLGFYADSARKPGTSTSRGRSPVPALWTAYARIWDSRARSTSQTPQDQQPLPEGDARYPFGVLNTRESSVYGFNDVDKNFNRDKPRKTRGVPLDSPQRNPLRVGLSSRVGPTLTNQNNAIDPTSKSLYCALTDGGLMSLQTVAFEVRKYVPGSWKPNFPQRDCSPWHALREAEAGDGGIQ